MFAPRREAIGSIVCCCIICIFHPAQCEMTGWSWNSGSRPVTQDNRKVRVNKQSIIKHGKDGKFDRIMCEADR